MRRIRGKNTTVSAHRGKTTVKNLVAGRYLAAKGMSAAKSTENTVICMFFRMPQQSSISQAANPESAAHASGSANVSVKKSTGTNTAAIPNAVIILFFISSVRPVFYVLYTAESSAA